MSDTTETGLDALVDRMFTREEPAQAESEEMDAPEELDAPEAEVDTEAEEAPDDEGEEAPEAEAPETPKFKVKVDGEEIEVTQDELLRGYSGQAKIQKGLREAAEARKEAEAFAAALQQQREAVFALVQEVQQSGLLPAPVAPDPALAERDPVGYVRANAQYQAQLAEYLQQQQLIEQTAQQHRAVQQQQEARMREEGVRKLVELIPDLADQEKAPQVHRMIVRAGEAYGYTADEIGSVMDPRALHILYKAAQYDAMQQAKAKVADKVAKAQPVLKPTATASNPAGREVTQLRNRLKQSGRIEDAASLLLKRN